MTNFKNIINNTCFNDNQNRKNMQLFTIHLLQNQIKNQNKDLLTQLSHIENHKFTIFKSFIKPHK